MHWSITCESQYAVDAPAYPLPMITTSVSTGSSSVDRKSRRGDSAASIQYDFVGLATGRTMLTEGNDVRGCSLLLLLMLRVQRYLAHFGASYHLLVIVSDKGSRAGQ